MDLPALPPIDGLVPPSEKQPWKNADYQRFWLSIQHKSWRTLALVPGGGGQSPDFTLLIAMSLARTGMTHLGGQVHVADGTTLPMAAASQFAVQVRESAASGPVLIALGACAESPVAVTLAKKADCAVLCVKMGRMTLADAKRTVQEIGADQFIGSLAVR